jgi:thiol-disulfide isomerase/thioredoxin
MSDVRGPTLVLLTWSLSMIRVTFVLPLALLAAACASSPPVKHGTITTMSAASSADAPRCQHGVPGEVCTRCHPELVAKFKAAKDWCVEHEVAESQCLECHPDLTFDPLPALPANADLKELSQEGEDVPSLEAHVVPGKVTLFDFYAVWCAPCRKIDAHVFALLGKRDDLALRKLNVVSWETPLAERYLKNIPALPFIVVYGKDGKKVDTVTGLDLGALDRAIAKAGAR